MDKYIDIPEIPTNSEEWSRFIKSRNGKPLQLPLWLIPEKIYDEILENLRQTLRPKEEVDVPNPNR